MAAWWRPHDTELPLNHWEPSEITDWERTTQKCMREGLMCVPINSYRCSRISSDNWYIICTERQSLLTTPPSPIKCFTLVDSLFLKGDGLIKKTQWDTVVDIPPQQLAFMGFKTTQIPHAGWVTIVSLLVLKVNSSQRSSARGLASSPVIEDDQDGKEDLLKLHSCGSGHRHTSSTGTVCVAHERSNWSSRVSPKNGINFNSHIVIFSLVTFV